MEKNVLTNEKDIRNYIFDELWLKRRAKIDVSPIGLSNFNTGKVKDMGNMFEYCHKLKAVDLSNFDTSNVTDMSHMFKRCYELTSLDLSSFNTSNVRDMNRMFQGCYNH